MAGKLALILFFKLPLKPINHNILFTAAHLQKHSEIDKIIRPCCSILYSFIELILFLGNVLRFIDFFKLNIKNFFFVFNLKVSLKEFLIGPVCNNFGFCQIKAAADCRTHNRNHLSQIDNSLFPKFGKQSEAHFFIDCRYRFSRYSFNCRDCNFFTNYNPGLFHIFRNIDTRKACIYQCLHGIVIYI